MRPCPPCVVVLNNKHGRLLTYTHHRRTGIGTGDIARTTRTPGAVVMRDVPDPRAGGRRARGVISGV